MSYREGEAAARIAELEEAVRVANERSARLERQLWAQRKRVGTKTAMGFLSAVGMGALVGIALGTAGWLGTENPNWLWASALVGALFGGIGRVLWLEPDNKFSRDDSGGFPGDFPPPPGLG